MSFPTTPGSLRLARTRSMTAVLAAVAVALSGAVATTGAEADPGGPIYGENQRISVKGGYAEFRHYGEILEVNDGVLDGRGVRVYFGGRAPSTVTDYDLSDYRADGDPVRMNLSIPEGEKVVMKVCYTVDHERDQCSEWQNAVA